MSVHIRLARHGSKKAAFYRIVVADQRSPRDGCFIETLGTYHPGKDPGVLQVNRARLEHWTQRGAQPSHTLARLLKLSAAEATAKEVQSA